MGLVRSDLASMSIRHVDPNALKRFSERQCKNIKSRLSISKPRCDSHLRVRCGSGGSRAQRPGRIDEGPLVDLLEVGKWIQTSLIP